MGKQITNYQASSDQSITFVPQLTDFFDTWPANWKGKLTRTWILFFEGLKSAGATPPIVGFIMNTGATGTNVGPMLPAGRTGAVDVVVLVVKASDGAVALAFDIKQNGKSIFAIPPSIPAGTASGSLFHITNLASSPLDVAEDDVFTIDISTGSSSWQFVAALEKGV